MISSEAEVVVKRGVYNWRQNWWDIREFKLHVYGKRKRQIQFKNFSK